MELKTLPEKYYLDHFHEFIDYMAGPCAQLMDQDDLNFIKSFRQLEEDEQCVLVRSANRKSPIIKRSSLQYDEIQNEHEQIGKLLAKGYFSDINLQHLDELLDNLTKPELFAYLTFVNCTFKKSTPKSSLVELAQQHSKQRALDWPELDNYIVRSFDPNLNYFLFVFFGDVKSKLNKFSLRDLGIMRTRKRDAANVARFDTLLEAKTAFLYHSLNLQLKHEEASIIEQHAQSLASLPEAIGNEAQNAKDKYLYTLGNAYLKLSPSEALPILGQSTLPQAQEKWIREQYKQGETTLVKQRLEQIIQQPDSEHLLMFAEDFSARKFAGKRTSMLTDMLRKDSQLLHIDECYRNTVEKGVILHYQNKGLKVFHTENQLWKALFGLIFWEELHNLDESALTNEFDTKPTSIVKNYFYDSFATEIEQRLSTIGTAPLAIQHVSKMASLHYGKVNGIFMWQSNILNSLVTLLQAVDFTALKRHLTAMAKDYNNLSDGYPDLMVVDKGKVRFEEVKAPGDQLRKNQLLCIQKLRQAGFDVGITRVDWYIDPNQTYVVVDVETTGGKSAQHRITEIGMVKMVGDTVIDTWQSLINPERHIPHFITNLTGINDDMVRDAPTFFDICESVEAFIEGCVFVAHNAAFDYSFFKAEFERCGRHFSMPKLCTVREMRKAQPGLKSYSLANLATHFGIDMSQHHRALSDAQAAAELLQIVQHHRLNPQ